MIKLIPLYVFIVVKRYVKCDVNLMVIILVLFRCCRCSCVGVGIDVRVFVPVLVVVLILVLLGACVRNRVHVMMGVIQGVPKKVPMKQLFF